MFLPHINQTISQSSTLFCVCQLVLQFILAGTAVYLD